MRTSTRRAPATAIRFTRIPAAILAALLLAGAAAAAHAAEPTERDLTELSLDQLMEIEIPTVVAASRFEQRTVDAPSSVSIVTAEEIARFGYQTLGEILSGVSGLYVSNDRNYTYLGVRGFGRPGDYNTRVLLLIDGHRLNDDIYDQAALGTEGVLDVELIERVEVVRGPASSIYGANAFFGTINIVTKRGDELAGGEFQQEGASWWTAGGRLAFGRKTPGGLDVIVSASGFRSAGQDLYFREFDTPATNRGVAEGCDSDRYGRLFGKVARGGFTFEAGFSSREKRIPTAAFGTAFNDSRTRTTDERSFVDLRYDLKLGAASDVSVRLFDDRYRYTGDYAYSDGTSYVNRDTAQGNSWGGEAIGTIRALSRHVITTGIEYRDNYRQDQGNYDVDPYFEYLRSEKSTSVLAFYAQDTYTPSKRTIVSLGVRHDRYSTFGGTTNPRLAFVFKPRERTALKFLAGRAFRAPNAYEMFYTTFTALPNPALGHESIDTYEAVLETDAGRGLRLSASAFEFRTKGLITQELDPETGLAIFQNADGARSSGTELSLERRWPKGPSARLTYSYQKTVDERDGAILADSPRHLAKLHVLADLAGPKLLGGLEALYSSRRKTLGGGEAGGFVVLNATLLSRLIPNGLEISASAYNLLDRRYGVPGSAEHLQDVLIQDGRSFRLRLAWRF